MRRSVSGPGGRVRAMDAARRLALGQWFTPLVVADLALSLALPRGARGAGSGAGLRLVDPACGDGAFLACAQARGLGTGAGGALCGVELDPAIATAARDRAPGASVHQGDLFALEPEALGAPFDVVVGNPPYVRQERLTRAQKQRIRARLGRDFPELPGAALDRVLGRGDLAAACILRALRLARPGGRVALVVSSALLDAGYAAALWDVVSGCGHVRAVVDAPAERWFADAGVNAVILVLERASGAAPRAPGRAGPAAGSVRLARLRVSTAEAARRVRGLEDLVRVSEIRQAPADAPARWAAGLRASAAWFEVEAAAGDGLVPLGTLAEVRRGVTSGANEVFYLPRERAGALGIEPELLWPLLRSPRRATTIAVEPRAATHVALVCPPGPAQARGAGDAWPRQPGARRYLQSHRHVAERPSLRVRQPWWALPVRPARLFMTKAYAARFVQHLAPVPVVADQRVYTIHPVTGIDVELLAAVLNASFTAFAIESLGRASMGEGALEWTVADAASLPVLDPRRLAPGQARMARQALADMAGRAIGDVAGERAARDRARLDLAVSAAAPALAGMLDAVWDALIASVAHRHTRARQGGS
jgi:adenine-specific DNA-methyltransferase